MSDTLHLVFALFDDVTSLKMVVCCGLLELDAPMILILAYSTFILCLISFWFNNVGYGGYSYLLEPLWWAGLVVY